MNLYKALEPKIEIKVEATPKEGDTLKDLEINLIKQGYKIISINKETITVELKNG